MLRALKGPENIGYQLALTSSELRDIFKNAAPIPKADAEAESSDGNRKPIEGECPICYTEFESDKDATVYCKVSCGNNVHKESMGNWACVRVSKSTCPYCRAIWHGDDFAGKKVGLGVQRNAEGYLNVASQLGLSEERAMSHAFDSEASCTKYVRLLVLPPIFRFGNSFETTGCDIISCSFRFPKRLLSATYSQLFLRAFH
ncbi:hypothetical protein BCR34DRAFT_209094 [Clohesyomyces aquaticus]|uniref:RING-type domain-containing protein n=1 Tax=Clohesyomyces aquaticus TaxID=1231657 RepID=A0A1Y2A9P5_9PLEO|nr:hypothetical protein BCR34DRAFT_209094 [Clohesyomyces aquaticus]